MVDSAIENLLFPFTYANCPKYLPIMKTNLYIRQENIYRNMSGGCSALSPKTARKYVLGFGNLLARTGRFGLHDAGRLCGVQR